MHTPIRQKPSNLVIETVKQEEVLQPPAVETSFELPVVSPPDPRICPLGTSHPGELDYDDYECEVIMSVFDAKNQI